MSEILGFPKEMAVYMLGIAVAYFLVVHSPAIFALITVWRHRKSMPRRILFIGTVVGATYGLLTLFIMAVCVPIEVFTLFIVPTLQDQGYLKSSVALAIVNFASDWWWTILPFTILIPAIFISRYFEARWHRIVQALND